MVLSSDGQTVCFAQCFNVARACVRLRRVCVRLTANANITDASKK